MESARASLPPPATSMAPPLLWSQASTTSVTPYHMANATQTSPNAADLTYVLPPSPVLRTSCASQRPRCRRDMGFHCLIHPWCHLICALQCPRRSGTSVMTLSTQCLYGVERSSARGTSTSTDATQKLSLHVNSRRLIRWRTRRSSCAPSPICPTTCIGLRVIHLAHRER